MKLNSLPIKTFVASAAVFLAGCGGGGGNSGWTGSTPSEPPASKLAFPIEATMTSVATSSFSKTLRYTDANGVIYSIDYSSVPGGDTTFNGKAAKTAAVTAVFKVNGVEAGTSFQTTYFQIGPLKLLGYLSGDGKYGLADSQVALPATATVGSAGKFYSTTEYASNVSIPIGNEDYVLRV